MTSPPLHLRNLAAAFLAGPWSLAGLLERGTLACGASKRQLRPLVRRLLVAFSEPPPDAHVLRFLTADRDFPRLCPFGEFRQLFWVPPTMRPAPGAPASWQVPALATAGALADWLGLEPRTLDWFADCHGRATAAPAGPLRHYTYRWLVGRRGKRRLLEMPKQRLKALQRRLLHEILDRIPPHEAVHGFRRGRSILTYAAPHAGRDIVLHFDLRDFFPSVQAARVHALFRTAGYPTAVARLLTGLCTSLVPSDIWETAGELPGRSAESRYRVRHLPQGAPTSPALANLCAYRLDRRLAGLARAVEASYTRYADDLAFSGGQMLERAARRFQVQVCRLALEEGFEVNTRKSRFMRQGVRQQLAGVVVNTHPNVRRDEYDRLKAILWNCVRLGPAGQDRDGHADFRAHLAGRIAHVAAVNAGRALRLHALLDRIAWEARG